MAARSKEKDKLDSVFRARPRRKGRREGREYKISVLTLPSQENLGQPPGSLHRPKEEMDLDP